MIFQKKIKSHLFAKKTQTENSKNNITNENFRKM